jgi:glycosyltransferase involved in cell wall biosynthesis
MAETDLMVSICCTTYNHEQFIAQTVDSFLAQQTDFDFEIVIGDDCSTDGTSAILKLFKEKYPDIITIITPEKNVGAHQNMIDVVKMCRGKYIALCDGDDYWTNPHKLQKQVNFLEANPEYTICCHHTRVIDQDGNTLYVAPAPKPLIYTYFDLIAGRQAETKTATVVYRNLAEIHQLFKKPWYTSCHAADKFLKLFATYITGGKIYVMPEIMSCYRNHVGGVWSMIRDDARMDMVISDFNLIIKKFHYRRADKINLLLLYLKRYLRFELKNRRLNSVYQTVRYLI